MQNHWRTTSRIMGIRRRASNKATVDQALRKMVGSTRVKAGCVYLGKATTLDPTVKDMPVTTNVGVALHMGQNRGDALQLQAEDDIVHVGGQVLIREFKQQVRALVRKGQDVALLHLAVQLGLKVHGGLAHDDGGR